MDPGGLGRVSIAIVLRVAAGVGNIREEKGWLPRDGYQRTIPRPPRMILRAHRSARYAVPAQSHNLQLARVKLRKLDSSLVAFTASAEEERFIQAFWEQVCQPLPQLDHGRREHSTEEVVQASGVLGDCLYDLRMAMPNQARHLPGCIV